MQQLIVHSIEWNTSMHAGRTGRRPRRQLAGSQLAASQLVAANGREGTALHSTAKGDCFSTSVRAPSNHQSRLTSAPSAAAGFSSRLDRRQRPCRATRKATAPAKAFARLKQLPFARSVSVCGIHLSHHQRPHRSAPPAAAARACGALDRQRPCTAILKATASAKASAPQAITFRN
jgi:hypothetical protein